jgi:hypothetical protein
MAVSAVPAQLRKHGRAEIGGRCPLSTELGTLGQEGGKACSCWLTAGSDFVVASPGGRNTGGSGGEGVCRRG